jgi:hypothetical protein
MSAIELALKYMEIVFSGKNLSELKFILSDDCKFVGPLYKFD